MSRLFTSEFDKTIYGEPSVAKMNAFYDKVDLIQEKHTDEIKGISLDDTFGFDIASYHVKGLIFNKDYKFSDEIKEEIFKVFREHYQNG